MKRTAIAEAIQALFPPVDDPDMVMLNAHLTMLANWPPVRDTALEAYFDGMLYGQGRFRMDAQPVPMDNRQIYPPDWTP